MLISKDTLTILKNFATINPNLIITPGNKISTITTGRNIVAEAVVPEEFPITFGIYDLNELLSAISLFENPELEFSEKILSIKEGKNVIKYLASPLENMTLMPKLKAFPEPDIEFDITSNILKQIQQISAILKKEFISITGDGNTVVLKIYDKNNASSNSFEADIGTTDKTFCLNFSVKSLKLLPYDYHVKIVAKKRALLTNSTQTLLYIIALELDSTFDF